MPPAQRSALRARPGPLRADAARNRAQILEVARRELVGGSTVLPMNLIARAAEVGVGTVYRHFPTRQSLLEALAHDSLQTIVAETAAAAAADPVIGLHRALLCTLTCQLEDVALAEILTAPTFECVDTLELGEQLAESVATLLARARRARVIRRDITPDDIRRLLAGTVHALAAGPHPESHIDLYLQVLINGLRPRPRPDTRSA